jgi:hypothetical protein
VTTDATPKRRLLLTSLLESPRLCGWILGAGVVHVALATTPLQGWRCPFFQATGIPCPGCGLGRAAVLLLRGHFRDSLHMHAFAIPALAMLLVLGLGLLPGTMGANTRTGVRWVEERTWLVQGLLAALLIYWISRFALDATGFRTLVV